MARFQRIVVLLFAILIAHFVLALPFYSHNYVAILSDLHHPYFKKTIDTTLHELLKIRPMHVFILGDLTEMGKDSEFESLSKSLSVLIDSKIGYNTLLGNHDVRWADKIRKTTRISNALYEIFRVDIDKLSFMSVDTSMYFQHLGHITDVQIEWIEKQLEECRKEGKVAILLSHHPFGGPVDYTDDGWKLMKIVKRYNVPLILYGHTHKYDYFGTYDGIFIQSVGATQEGWITILSWDNDNIYIWKKNAIQNEDYKLVRKISMKKSFIEDQDKEKETKVNSKYLRELFSYKLPNSIFSQPIVYNNRFYVVDYSGDIICLDTTGNIVWKNTIGPILANLEISNNILFVGSIDGILYFFDPKNGVVKGTMNLKFPIFSLKSSENSPLLLIGAGEHLIIFDTKESKIRTQYDAKGTVQSPAFYSNGKFFQTTWSGDVLIVDSSGVLLKKLQVGSGYYTPGGIIPLVIDDFLFVTNPSGVVQSYNWKTLEKVWEVRGLKTGYSGIEKLDKILITAGINGTIYALNSIDGKILWQVKTNSPIYSILPTIFPDGRIVVGTTRGEIVMISKNGKLLEKIEVYRSYLIKEILFIDNMLFLTFTDGTIKVFLVLK
ncbi:MAG: PQQ-binding-like beta-propeller repeat protein [Fervidobacterium sp.]